ncbi:hypothetical protein VSWAT3_04096 [Vibrionales bacterium SWAT-3]|nr:hypothetical protein VSWAT3_04096 [Vibrionales bacterium SWAT-3]
MLKAKAQKVVDTLNVIIEQESEFLFFLDLGIDPAQDKFILSDFTIIPRESGLEMTFGEIIIDASNPNSFYISNNANWRDICLVTQKVITKPTHYDSWNNFDEADSAFWESKGGYEEWLKR